eukprot:975196-Pleurochrysis_carterae.AAC.1
MSVLGAAARSVVRRPSGEPRRVGAVCSDNDSSKDGRRYVSTRPQVPKVPSRAMEGDSVYPSACSPAYACPSNWVSAYAFEQASA